MNIWIDGYESNVPQRLGSSQVAFELLKNIECLDRKNNYTILLPAAPLDDLPRPRKNWNYKILHPSFLWTRIALPLAIIKNRKNIDVFFSPTHYLPLVPRTFQFKRIVTIFDLSYLHHPELFKRGDLWKLTNWSKYSVKTADHIVTISNFSKKDIIKNYHIEKQKITVAYPGYDEEFFPPKNDTEIIENLKKKYAIHGDYAVFVGTIQPRKNIARLIEAFSKIDNLKLVIVGKTDGLGRSGWMFNEILKTPAKLGIEDKVIFTGFVPSLELSYLVASAKVFVLPSLWEGFGIPAVDAMSAGVPVVVSNVSSLPEVVGKAGLLVDPRSTDQIEQAVRTAVTDKKLRQKMIKLALGQARKYSWKKMARIVLKTFKTV